MHPHIVECINDYNEALKKQNCVIIDCKINDLKELKELCFQTHDTKSHYIKQV